MTAILEITDGTTVVDLLGTDGYILNSWRPTIAGYKSDGTYQSSSLSDGRRLVHKVFEGPIERFDLKARNVSQDILIKTTQELRRLLEKASDYWTTTWQDEPVWIKAKATRETNSRYAIIQVGKIPEDDNPMSMPFLQPDCESAMDGLTLLVERGHWLANEPGSGACVEVSGTQDWAMTYPLVYDGLSQKITVPAVAFLNDIPDLAVAGRGQITVHGWITANGYGEGTAGRIAVKGSNDSATRGWHFYLDPAVGLVAKVDCATTDAVSTSGLDEFTADGEKHHVLMTYDEDATPATLPVGRTVYLAIDGVWVASYDTQQVSVGNYSPDNADDMVIGNNVAVTATFDGEIGWMEVRDDILHTPSGGNFTAPARCPFPLFTAHSAWLGIREGEGTIIYDSGMAGSDGTAVNDDWGDGCEVTFGRTETCEDEVYVANKHNMAQLTHVLLDDFDGAWTDLLATALPYGLLPAAPGDGDIIYFGIDTAVLNSGPFCSLVFDIGTAATFGAGDSLDWEYWNGAWVALTIQDNTNAAGLMTGDTFDTAGVASVHWLQEDDWVATAINGITAFWVRAVLTEATGVTTPTQQNRHPYTIVWPYVEIAADQVLGDIPALAQTIIKNQSDRSTVVLDPKLYANRIIAALRSSSRGADFTPYINLADEQNDAGMSVDVGAGANATFTANVETQTGRQVTLTNPPAAWNDAVTITLDATLAPQYKGEYHAFLRGELTVGLLPDLELRLSSRMGDGGGYTLYALNTVNFPVLAADHVIMDFGTLKIPPSDILTDSDEMEVKIVIEAYGSAGTTSNLYDLILIPVDEWVGDYAIINTAVTAPNWGRRGTPALQAKLDVDGISNPKNAVRALIRVDPSDEITDVWKPRATAPILQANAAQKLWFLAIVDTMVASGYNTSQHEIAASVTSWSSDMYLSMRGAR